MSKENKVRVYNRLFAKLYLNYAVMMLVTAVLICLIFMKLYQDRTIEDNIKELDRKASEISEITTEFMMNGNQDEYLNQINTLIRVNNTYIWTVAKPDAKNKMPAGMETGVSYEEFIKVPEFKQYVDNLNTALNGIANHQNPSYDEAYGVDTITTAAPIYDASREVVGAVLIISMVDDQTEIIQSSLFLIVLSSVVALGISFIIIIIFATELSMPISRMRATALELAAEIIMLRQNQEG
jgi:signal transduction histidine kinase